MKNKLSTIIWIIRNLLPMNRYSIFKNNKNIMNLLHAQTEMLMLNRHDIMTMAAIEQKSDKKNVSCVSKTNNIKNMYG